MAQNNFLEKNSKLIIGLVVVYFGYNKVIKPLLDTFGLTKSDEEKNIDKEIVNENSAFNPNFWRKSGATIIKEDAVQKFINIIWGSVGYLYDDFDAVLGVFKQLKTKSQVSYLTYKFNLKKNKDLLNWLLGGSGLSWPADRFSADQVNQILRYVNSLRNY